MWSWLISGDRKKLMGWNVPKPILMWIGSKVVAGVTGVTAVCARTIGRGHSVGSVSCPAGSGKGNNEEVVAMISMPVLSRPKKKSRPSVSRGTGMIVFPIGTLPGGTILRNRGGLGSPSGGGGNVRLTAELSQVLRMASVEGGAPPASRAKDPVELKAIEVAGADSGKVCRDCRVE